MPDTPPETPAQAAVPAEPAKPDPFLEYDIDDIISELGRRVGQSDGAPYSILDYGSSRDEDEDDDDDDDHDTDKLYEEMANALRERKKHMGPDNPIRKIVGEYTYDLTSNENAQEKIRGIQAQVGDYLRSKGLTVVFDVNDRNGVTVIGKDGKQERMKLSKAYRKFKIEEPKDLQRLMTTLPPASKETGQKIKVKISADPVDVMMKSSGQIWEEGSCERYWGEYSEGPFDDIAKGNAVAFFYTEGKSKPSVRFSLRWCEHDGRKDVGIEPRSYPHGVDNFEQYWNMLVDILEKKGLGKWGEQCVTPYRYRGYSDIMSSGHTTIKYFSPVSEGLKGLAKAKEVPYSLALALLDMDRDTRLALASNYYITTKEHTDEYSREVVKGLDHIVSRLLKDTDNEVVLSALRTNRGILLPFPRRKKDQKDEDYNPCETVEQLAGRSESIFDELLRSKMPDKCACPVLKKGLDKGKLDGKASSIVQTVPDECNCQILGGIADTGNISDLRSISGMTEYIADQCKCEILSKLAKRGDSVVFDRILPKTPPACQCEIYETAANNPDAGVRSVVAHRTLPDKCAVPLLKKLATDENETVREAVLSNEKFKTLPEACDFAQGMVEEDHYLLSSIALREIPGNCQAKIIKKFASGDGGQRMALAQNIGELPLRTCARLDLVKKLISDEEPDICKTALANMPGDTSCEALEELQKLPEVANRYLSSRLHKIPSDCACEVVDDLLSLKDPQVWKGLASSDVNRLPSDCRDKLVNALVDTKDGETFDTLLASPHISGDKKCTVGKEIVGRNDAKTNVRLLASLPESCLCEVTSKMSQDPDTNTAIRKDPRWIDKCSDRYIGAKNGGVVVLKKDLSPYKGKFHIPDENLEAWAGKKFNVNDHTGLWLKLSAGENIPVDFVDRNATADYQNWRMKQGPEIGVTQFEHALDKPVYILRDLDNEVLDMDPDQRDFLRRNGYRAVIVAPLDSRLFIASLEDGSKVQLRYEWIDQAHTPIFGGISHIESENRILRDKLKFYYKSAEELEKLGVPKSKAFSFGHKLDIVKGMTSDEKEFFGQRMGTSVPAEAIDWDYTNKMRDPANDIVKAEIQALVKKLLPDYPGLSDLENANIGTDSTAGTSVYLTLNDSFRRVQDLERAALDYLHKTRFNVLADTALSDLNGTSPEGQGDDVAGYWLHLSKLVQSTPKYVAPAGSADINTYRTLFGRIIRTLRDHGELEPTSLDNENNLNFATKDMSDTFLYPGVDYLEQNISRVLGKTISTLRDGVGLRGGSPMGPADDLLRYWKNLENLLIEHYGTSVDPEQVSTYVPIISKIIEILQANNLLVSKRGIDPLDDSSNIQVSRSVSGIALVSGGRTYISVLEEDVAAALGLTVDEMRSGSNLAAWGGPGDVAQGPAAEVLRYWKRLLARLQEKYRSMPPPAPSEGPSDETDIYSYQYYIKRMSMLLADHGDLNSSSCKGNSIEFSTETPGTSEIGYLVCTESGRSIGRLEDNAASVLGLDRGTLRQEYGISHSSGSPEGPWPRLLSYFKKLADLLEGHYAEPGDEEADGSNIEDYRRSLRHISNLLRGNGVDTQDFVVDNVTLESDGQNADDQELYHLSHVGSMNITFLEGKISDILVKSIEVLRDGFNLTGEGTPTGTGRDLLSYWEYLETELELHYAPPTEPLFHVGDRVRKVRRHSDTQYSRYGASERGLPMGTVCEVVEVDAISAQVQCGERSMWVALNELELASRPRLPSVGDVIVLKSPRVIRNLNPDLYSIPESIITRMSTTTSIVRQVNESGVGTFRVIGDEHNFDFPLDWIDWTYEARTQAQPRIPSVGETVYLKSFEEIQALDIDLFNLARSRLQQYLGRPLIVTVVNTTPSRPWFQAGGDDAALLIRWIDWNHYERVPNSGETVVLKSVEDIRAIGFRAIPPAAVEEMAGRPIVVGDVTTAADGHSYFSYVGWSIPSSWIDWTATDAFRDLQGVNTKDIAVYRSIFRDIHTELNNHNDRSWPFDADENTWAYPLTAEVNQIRNTSDTEDRVLALLGIGVTVARATYNLSYANPQGTYNDMYRYWKSLLNKLRQHYAETVPGAENPRSISEYKSILRDIVNMLNDNGELDEDSLQPDEIGDIGWARDPGTIEHNHLIPSDPIGHLETNVLNLTEIEVGDWDLNNEYDTPHGRYDILYRYWKHLRVKLREYYDNQNQVESPAEPEPASADVSLVRAKNVLTNIYAILQEHTRVQTGSWTPSNDLAWMDSGPGHVKYLIPETMVGKLEDSALDVLDENFRVTRRGRVEPMGESPAGTREAVIAYFEHLEALLRGHYSAQEVDTQPRPDFIGSYKPLLLSIINHLWEHDADVLQGSLTAGDLDELHWVRGDEEYADAHQQNYLEPYNKIGKLEKSALAVIGANPDQFRGTLVNTTGTSPEGSYDGVHQYWIKLEKAVREYYDGVEEPAPARDLPRESLIIDYVKSIATRLKRRGILPSNTDLERLADSPDPQSIIAFRFDDGAPSGYLRFLTPRNDSTDGFWALDHAALAVVGTSRDEIGAEIGANCQGGSPNCGSIDATGRYWENLFRRIVRWSEAGV